MRTLIVYYSRRGQNLIKRKGIFNKAAEENDNIIRIGTSPMTPGYFLTKLLPRIQEYCTNVRFQFVTFENTPENAREILRKLGQNIDVVAGPFDLEYLAERECEALKLSQQPIRCAVSIDHPLASKKSLTVQDLYGENLLLIQRGWNRYVDALRDDMENNHPQIHIKDFDFFSVSVFNQCENSNDVLMTIDNWKTVHPLLKVLPVEWEHSVPFGLMHSPKPSPLVKRFLKALQSVTGE